MFNGVNFDYDGAHVLVTGGSNGIGLSIATAYRDSGANVTITGRRERASDYSHDLSGMNYCQLEVTDHDQIIHALGNIEELDILVNNAGMTRDGLLLRMSADDWDGVFALNLKAAFLLTQKVSRGMLKARSGVVINVSSVVGHTGNAGQANYAAAKAGLDAFTKSCAREFASRKIRVNAVAPGFIDTEMTQGLPDAAKVAMMN